MIEIGVCCLLFVLHVWILLFHKQKMGSDQSDSPQDPIFSKMNQHFSFFNVLSTHAVFAYRRISIRYEMPVFDFLNFGAVLPADYFTLTAGTIVFMAGLLLRVWAIRILGRFFTFEIGIRKEHALIQEGPYKLLRHPSYTGYLLMLVGAGISLASIFSVVALVAPVMVFLILRMNHEESMLLKHFGDNYRAYQLQTKKIIPFVY